METNNKSFSLRIVTGKVVPIILAGFQYATSLFFNFGIRVPITFIGKSIERILPNIYIKQISLRIISKLISAFSTPMGVSRIIVGVIAREKLKSVVPIKLRVRLYLESRGTMKATSIIFLRNLRISASPTIATFYTLAQHDPTALSVHDTKTLMQMDYSS